MQHTPDERRRGELTLDGKKVRLRLDGKDLEPEQPTGTRSETKPKPPEPDDPRSALERNLPPYVGGVG